MRMIKDFLFLLLLLGGVSVANANDYPTSERISYVLQCFQELDRATLDDMQTCSCRIDSIASNIPFEEYSYAVTYDRNRRMTGEKGGIFRDNEAGKAFSKKLLVAQETSRNQCKKVVQIVAPTDLTKDER